jgi:hypothetical protein
MLSLLFWFMVACYGFYGLQSKDLFALKVLPRKLTFYSLVGVMIFISVQLCQRIAKRLYPDCQINLQVPFMFLTVTTDFMLCLAFVYPYLVFIKRFDPKIFSNRLLILVAFIIAIPRLYEGYRVVLTGDSSGLIFTVIDSMYLVFQVGILCMLAHPLPKILKQSIQNATRIANILSRKDDTDLKKSGQKEAMIIFVTTLSWNLMISAFIFTLLDVMEVLYDLSLTFDYPVIDSFEFNPSENLKPFLIYVSCRFAQSEYHKTLNEIASAAEEIETESTNLLNNNTGFSSVGSNRFDCAIPIRYRVPEHMYNADLAHIEK